jgi:hypothetical protein
MTHLSSEELRELNRRAESARGYKDQRDVLQAELDATRAVLATESGHVERQRTANLELVAALDRADALRDHYKADLDAVVAERDAALERVAELEVGFVGPTGRIRR